MKAQRSCVATNMALILIGLFLAVEPAATQEPAAQAPGTAVSFLEPYVVTVSGYGPTRQAAEAAAFQAARETSPYFRVKKETYERSGIGWVCTMEIWVE